VARFLAGMVRRSARAHDYSDLEADEEPFVVSKCPADEDPNVRDASSLDVVEMPLIVELHEYCFCGCVTVEFCQVPVMLENRL